MAASTASFPLSKLLQSTKPSLSSSTATTSAAFHPTPLSSSASSLSRLSLKLRSQFNPKPLKFSAATTKITGTIAVGDKLPDTLLSFVHPSGDIQLVPMSSITKNKKTILFAVPGAFTPTCSQKHLPGFVEMATELKSKGVDVIACISVNDAFVMKAWKQDLRMNDDVMMLSDGCGDFTKAIGCELNLSDKPEGLGMRSRRYSMLVEDGVVKVLNLEEGGAFTSSGAEDILKVL